MSELRDPAVMAFVWIPFGLVIAFVWGVSVAWRRMGASAALCAPAAKRDDWEHWEYLSAP
jgi:hypothetical protein